MMIKRLIIISMLITLTFASTCTPNQPCGANEGEACHMTQDCIEGLYCPSATVCTKYQGPGQSCSYGDLRCYSPYSCDPVSSKCVQASYVSQGGWCNHDYQCIGSLKCNNSACSYTPGLAQGANCSTTDDCPFGFYCTKNDGTGYCAAEPQIGGACLNGQCALGSTCLNGTCTAIYSGGLGAGCNDLGQSNTNTICDIAQGLNCNGSNCILIPTPTPATTNCVNTTSVDSICNKFENCYCTNTNGSTGRCYSEYMVSSDNLANCKKATIALNQCLITNKCITNYYTSQIPVSCELNKCPSEVCIQNSMCTFAGFLPTNQTCDVVTYDLPFQCVSVTTASSTTSASSSTGGSGSTTGHHNSSSFIQSNIFYSFFVVLFISFILF